MRKDEAGPSVSDLIFDFRSGVNRVGATKNPTRTCDAEICDWDEDVIRSEDHDCLAIRNTQVV